ncbi:hypothetical protein B0J14DRAFT_488417 [Halenospora varia]|nr:hypothetical protein B0J14DRAFT_488417 [Halenospora varia]
MLVGDYPWLLACFLIADCPMAMPVLATCWVLSSIAGSVVAARVYAQARILHQFGWGDAIMILAMVCGSLFCFTHAGLNQTAHIYGFGRHFFYLHSQQRLMAMKVQLINQPMGIMPATLGRVSLIMLMLHLFGGSIGSRRWILRLLLAQTLLVNIATCITIFTQCQRVETLWDPVGVPSICWDHNVQTYIGYSQGACNSATDLILTCMSITLVRTLPLKFRLKLGLSILLGLSGLAFVASVVKTIELRRLGDRLDFTFNAIPLVLWCSIENTVVIVAGSAPLLRSFFTRKTPNNTSYKMHQSSFGRPQGRSFQDSTLTSGKSQDPIQLHPCSENNSLTPWASQDVSSCPN